MLTPIPSSLELEITANAILVLESARLDMASNHQFKVGIRTSVRVMHIEIIASNSHKVSWIYAFFVHLVFERFLS